MIYVPAGGASLMPTERTLSARKIIFLDLIDHQWSKTDVSKKNFEKKNFFRAERSPLDIFSKKNFVHDPEIFSP